MRQKGFTLIELIVVIVVIGALGVGVTNFIGRSVQSYSDTGERQQVGTVAWIVSEKVTRAVRDALPNSFRLGSSDQCLEFIPTIAGSDYVTVPVLAAADRFDVVPFSSYSVNSARDRIAVYPNSLTGLYNLSSNGVISTLVSQLNAGSVTNAVQVQLASNHQFLGDSPTRRFYVVQNPEMLCFSGSRLVRYQNYGYQSSFSIPSSGALVVATDLQNGQFAYSPGTLSRTGIVTIQYDVTQSAGVTQTINQEVQVRNVP